MCSNFKQSIMLMAIASVSTINANAQVKENNDSKTIPAREAWAKSSVNTLIFRRNSSVTHKDTQYIAYYDEAQNVVLGKHKINSKKWELKATPYKGDATKAHKAINIMVDGDGYLHLSWGLICEPLNYYKGVSPGLLELNSKTEETGAKENRSLIKSFIV